MQTRSIEYLYYFLPVILFILDVCSFAVLEKQLLHALLALFCLQVLQPVDGPRLGILTLLSALESFLYYGRFGIQLVYLVPLALIGFALQNAIYSHRLAKYALLTGALLVQTWCIEYWILGLPISVHYTFSTFFVTLSVLWIISLTYE